MNKEERVSMNLFLLLVWVIFFPVFCFLLYTYIPIGTLCDCSKDDKLLLLVLIIIFYFYIMGSLYIRTQIDEDGGNKNKETKELSLEPVFVLLETKIIGGKIFTFSADFPKHPSVGEVLVVYSDDEDDYVEFTVEQVSMATNLPDCEDYLVKGQVRGLGQEKLSQYGWEEK